MVTLPSAFPTVLVSATCTGTWLFPMMVTVAVPSSFAITFGGSGVQVPPVHFTPGGRLVGVGSESVTLVPTGNHRAGVGWATWSPLSVIVPDDLPPALSGWSDVQSTVNTTSADAAWA